MSSCEQVPSDGVSTINKCPKHIALEPESTGIEQKSADREKPNCLEYERDEGWAWVVLFGATITMMVGHIPLMSFSVMYTPVFDEFDVSSTQIAWINGAYALFWNLIILFLGPLCEEFGWRKVGVCAVLINSAGIILSAWTPSPSLLYIYVSLMGGIGGSTLVAVCFFVVPHYFHERRGTAMAITSFGTCCATLVGPLLSVYLTNEFGGQWAFLILGAFLLNGIPSTLVFHPVKWHLKKQSAIEQTLLQNDTVAHQRKLTHATNIQKRRQSLSKQSLKIWSDTFRSFELLKQRRILYICLSTPCIYMGFITFQMWIPFAVVDRGLSLETASLCMSASAIANGTGRLFVVVFSEYRLFNRLIVFQTSLLSTAFSILLFGLSSRLVLVILFLVLWGFSIGVLMSLYHVVVIETVGLKLFPATFGLASLFAGVFIFLIGPVIGLVKDQSATFALPIGLIAALVLVSFIIWMTMPLAKKHDIKIQKLKTQSPDV